MRPAAALLVPLALLAGAPARAATVTVFAAASLQESLEAAARAFERRTGHSVVASYAGSNALARQIEAGAPAEIFFSADDGWIAYLQARGRAAAAPRPLAGNDLVLVAPARSAVQLRLAPGVDLAAALGGRRMALANPEAVPAGRYARAALVALGTWSAVERKLAATDNVRAALALVARGEAPLGVVYRTDAMAEPKVRIVDTFPAGTHPPVTYSMVRLGRAGEAAAAFESWLATAEARAIFTRHGFRAP